MVNFINIQYSNARKTILQFTANDADLCIVNAIRRIILAEVPTVAFNFDASDIDHSDITVLKNSCALHNEFLSHRISLIPLYFDENEVNNFDSSKYKFLLKKQNQGYEIADVTTKDFQIVDENGKEYPKDLIEKILPKNPITGDYILITKLKPNLYDDVSPPRGESIDIVCVPSVNNAMKHARWSPVSLCTYKNTIDEELSAKRLAQVLKEAEKEANRPLTPEEKAKHMQRFNTLEIFRCFKKNKYNEACSFDFSIETECRLRPAYLVFKALRILADKLSKLSSNIVNSHEDVSITQLTGVEDFFQIAIKHENHTLLNVLQSLIYNISFREKTPESNPIEYIGYYQPHPLDDLMVIKLKLRKLEGVIIDKSYVSDLMVDYIHEIETRVKEYIKEWLANVGQEMKDIHEVVDYNK